MPPLDSTTAQLILWAAIGYGLGSVPFGLLIARAMGLGNLRQIGSGNIGATNVLRTGNKGAAAATLLLDGAKGAAAVLLARAFAAPDAQQVAALAAFLGHCYPVWLGFRGGKGVATFLGLMLAVCWPAGLACCATWLAVAVLGRISSLSALVASVSSLLWLWVFGMPQAIGMAALATVILWIRHRPNIARLRAGTEPRIGK